MPTKVRGDWRFFSSSMRDDRSPARWRGLGTVGTVSRVWVLLGDRCYSSVETTRGTLGASGRGTRVVSKSPFAPRTAPAFRPQECGCAPAMLAMDNAHGVVGRDSALGRHAAFDEVGK